MEFLLRNVLGTHLHLADEWMFGYTYTLTDMGGNRDGTRRRSETDVLSDFMVAPTSMSMEMHMLSTMYGITDRLTLMAILPYKRLSMDHVTRGGGRFTTESEGIGDVEVMGHYSFYERAPHQVVFLASLGLPAGSIDVKDGTPAGLNQKLPYPMRLGSGTFDLKSALSYHGLTKNWAWGTHTAARISLGENSHGYKLGNRYHLNAWGMYGWTDWLSSSVRIDGKRWGNIDGADPDLDPALVPTADPARRGGRRIDLVLGHSFFMSRGRFKGFRFTIEGGLPAYQSLDGPQLETDWRRNIGWQWTF